jgi:hypothetical protein
MKEIKKNPLFYFHAQSLSYRFRIFWFISFSLDVDVTGNITAKICEVWREFNIVCTLVTMTTAAILIFFNLQKLPHTTLDIPTKFHEV